MRRGFKERSTHLSQRIHTDMYISHPRVCPSKSGRRCIIAGMGEVQHLLNQSLWAGLSDDYEMTLGLESLVKSQEHSDNGLILR